MIVDIVAARDGNEDVWQMAVRVSKAVIGSSAGAANVMCNSVTSAPAGSPVIKVVDGAGKVLVDGTGSGAFYSLEDVVARMQSGGATADPAAAIRDAMASLGSGGGTPKSGLGSPLEKGSSYTVSLVAGGGADMWQAAVQAGSLRYRVQQVAGLETLPAVLLRHDAPVAARQAVELLACAANAEGLGAQVYGGAALSEIEAALEKDVAQR